MCLLIAATTPGTLTLAQVKRALSSNRDGFGAAWFDGKAMHIARLGPADATPERVHTLVQRTSEFPRLWHWRYSTHGAVTLDNVHPFRIGKNAAWAHNGWSDMLARDQKRSDSRIVAEDLIGGMTLAQYRNSKLLLSRLLGTSRFAALYGSKLELSHGFTEEAGMFHSNGLLLSAPPARRKKRRARLTPDIRDLADILGHEPKEVSGYILTGVKSDDLIADWVEEWAKDNLYTVVECRGSDELVLHRDPRFWED